MNARQMRKRHRELTANAKPCPRCGMAPEIDVMMLHGEPYPEGLEPIHCPWRTPSLDLQTCGVYAQGLKAWNHQPLVDELRKRIAELEASP
jgi:hypothetical protein